MDSSFQKVQSIKGLTLLTLALDTIVSQVNEGKDHPSHQNESMVEYL